MTTARKVFSAAATKGVTLALFGRLTAATTAGLTASPDGIGYLLKQVDVSSIAVTAYVNNQSVGTDAPTVSSVIYDTLQTGNLWDTLEDTRGKTDRLGGNARYIVPATLLNKTAKKVDLEIMLTLTDGTLAPWLVTVEVTTGR